MFLPFHIFMKPLIVDNYVARSQGLLPDEWYWVDELAWKFGYTIDWFPNILKDN